MGRKATLGDGVQPEVEACALLEQEGSPSWKANLSQPPFPSERSHTHHS